MGCLSYDVVSRVFDIPKLTVCDIVHLICNAILAQEEIVHVPTVGQCAEVGCGFQQLSRSPAFSHCVGTIDGAHQGHPRLPEQEAITLCPTQGHLGQHLHSSACLWSTLGQSTTPEC